MNYVRNDGVNRPGQGYVGGIMEGLFVWFGRQVDMNALKNTGSRARALNNGPANREFNWNYSYHNNPYFMQYANPESDQRDRVIATGSATVPVHGLAQRHGSRTGTDTYRYNINTGLRAGKHRAEQRLEHGEPGVRGRVHAHRRQLHREQHRRRCSPRTAT